MKEMNIQISEEIVLPADAVTQTWGIVGRRGSGKTYGATKLYELFYETGVQCVALDPVGLWYGLRLDKDGKNPSGIDVPIFGGSHGDVPLTDKSGALIADFIVESGTSCIIDVSEFRKAKRKVFVADLAEQLFHAHKSVRRPIHLFIDEAQIFIPQRPGEGEQRMLGAMEDIVRLGRNFGMGASLITQRPQSVNKEVLNQVEPLVVFQLAAKHERRAIEEWIVHAGADIKPEMMNLSALKNGDGYFWSPAWVDRFESIRFLAKRSFDSTATPKLGQTLQSPTKLKPVDIGVLNEKISALVQEAESNDPTLLKKTILDLEWKLQHQQDGLFTEEEVRGRISAALEAHRPEPSVDIEALKSKLSACLDILSEEIPKPIATPIPAISGIKPTNNEVPKNLIKLSGKELTGPQTRIVDSLAWWLATPVKGPYTRAQVAFIAQYSPKGSAFTNPLGQLRTMGIVEFPAPGMVDLVPNYRLISEVFKPTQQELHEAILNKLSGPQRKILKPLLAAYPREMSRSELATASEYSEKGSAFTNPLGSLRSLGLVQFPQQGYAVASPDLFFGEDS
jgi:hypothetical protein